jgi:hypothetical protein
MIPTYQHHSPSSLNLFAAEPALWVLEKILDIKQPGNAKMHRGTATEAGVAHGLKGGSDGESINMALSKYDYLTALSGDLRRDDLRKPIPEMVTQALTALRPYGEPSSMQDYIVRQINGLKYPIVGYLDFKWEQKGLIVDLKTSEKMPSEISAPHARQVAYYLNSDNMRGELVYVTPKRCEAYKLEDVRKHQRSLLNIAKTVENFLALSDDPQFFVNITVPDLSSFYWHPPGMRELAYEHWKI